MLPTTLFWVDILEYPPKIELLVAFDITKVVTLINTVYLLRCIHKQTRVALSLHMEREYETD